MRILGDIVNRGGVLIETSNSAVSHFLPPVTWVTSGEYGTWAGNDGQARDAKMRRLVEMAVARGIELCTMTRIPAERSVAVAGSNHGALP